MMASTASDASNKSGRATRRGRLATTILRRTTDLLVIAIIAVGVFSVGGRLSEWWRTEPEDLAARPTAPSLWAWNDPAGMLLEFGDAPFALRHQRVVADPEDIQKQLVTSCRRALASSDVVVLDEAGEAQQRLLSRLQEQTPDWSGEDGSEVYVAAGPVMIAFGTRADTTRRLVCWALALPDQQGQWSVLTVHQAADADVSDRRSADDVRLPRGVRRSLSLRDVSGNVLLGFAGEGPASEWSRHFDDTLPADGWRPTRAWRTSDTAWSRSFQQTDPSRRLDIHLTRGEDRWSGLIHVDWGRGTDE